MTNTTETIMRLEAALPGLSERDADIIRMRYGWGNYAVPASLADVGRRYGLSRERVAEIEAHAIARGKRILAALERGE